MIIRTKYNVNQKIIVIYWDYDNRFGDGYWTTKEVFIKQIIIDKTGYYYEIENQGVGEKSIFEEHECYTDYSEANKECDKRNDDKRKYYEYR